MYLGATIILQVNRRFDSLLKCYVLSQMIL